MRIGLIAIIIALLAAPAFAQRSNAEKQQMQSEDRHERNDAEKRDRAKEIEAGYKNSLKLIPDKKAPDDPWRNMR